MGELLRRPTAVVRLSRPGRLHRIGRIADDERLIALMLIRDEADIVADCLEAATRWFDRILVLDGTTDPDDRRRTDEVLASYPEVVHVSRDEELPGAVLRDGARQYLLAEARRRYGVDNWIGILHADEIIDQDPRPMLASRHPARHPSIRVRLVHTFLHSDDEATWDQRAELPLRQRVRHAMWPGVPESRFFFDTGDRDYEIGRHAKVIPRSFRPGPLVDGFVVVQYNERSPAQVLERARQRIADGWQAGHYARFVSDPPELFTTTLDRDGSPFAPEFSGDPEGPFAPVHLDDVPGGPDPTRPPPLLVVEGDPEPDLDLGRRAVVGLGGVVGPGGLLDLVESPHRISVTRWLLTMWGLAERRGDRALVRHTAAVLLSRRATIGQRRTVAREFIHRLHDPSAGPAGWAAEAPAPQIEQLRAVVHRAVVHRAVVHNSPIEHPEPG